MRVDVITLFPELFEPALKLGMLGRAVQTEVLSVRLRSPRLFGLGKHQSVDDTPYGGGSGMVMRIDPLVACAESLDEDAPAESGKAHRILLSPTGRILTQAKVLELAARPAIMLFCGRYEGFDDRIRSFVDEDISLGDFVLAGGEIAALAVLDACSRLLPGVLGNSLSSIQESHSEAMGGLLEYPQFTRPVTFRGLSVPEVLSSGNHSLIEAWRMEQAQARTKASRPDLHEAWLERQPPLVPKTKRKNKPESK